MTTDDDSNNSANPNNTDDEATATSEDERILRHIMTFICDDDKGTVHEILTHAGVRSALDTLLFNEEALSKMKAKVAGKSQTPIPFTSRMLLLLFQKFHRCRQAKNLPYSVDAWTTECTRNAFDAFRTSTNEWDPDAGIPFDKPSATSTSTPQSATIGATHTTDPVTTFEKGIKHDPTLFPSLKDQKQWDLWWISTEAQAKAQNVHDVLWQELRSNTSRENSLALTYSLETGLNSKTF